MAFPNFDPVRPIHNSACYFSYVTYIFPLSFQAMMQQMQQMMAQNPGVRILFELTIPNFFD
jgi:hypothetical protein